MDAEPGFSKDGAQGDVALRLTGEWTVDHAHVMEVCANSLSGPEGAGGLKNGVTFDLGGLARLDTGGAWLIDRAAKALEEQGAKATFSRARPEHEMLLKAAHFRSFEKKVHKDPHPIIHFLADIGSGIVGAGKDFVYGVSFLGRIASAMGRLLVNPSRFRVTSVVAHVEAFAFRAVPIITLINFLVGCIVAQQGIYQLRRFGASTFAVDLIGILVLRELALLLTSIMVAGRTGSAITAELGSMKMREEIDALSVMGLDAIEVLIVPRIVGLLIALPLLTFLADMAAIFGGLVTAWGYEGIPPEIYLARLQSAISLNTFLTGLIKAPFMAMMIGMIASIEGLAVEGSAESLGRKVTDSVVKSIFMVIVVDGLFAMFFAGIRF